MSDVPDDLDALLIPDPMRASSLRDSLRVRTSRHVARVKRRQRMMMAAAIVAVFLAGGAAGWFARPGAPALLVLQPQSEQPPATQTMEAPPQPRPSEADRVAVIQSPNDAEIKAELSDDPAQTANYYLRAGDLYLHDRSDYANAARCYRLYLQHSDDGVLSPTASDSWLLLSLKNSAFQEKVYAKRNG